MPQWIFQGKFDDFEIPLLIQTFCNAVGTWKIQTNERESDLNQSSSLMPQLSKMDRQTSYTPKKETSQFNTYIETPLSVGISIHFHTITRSEQLVDKLKNVDIGISYEKLLSTENCLAGHVIEETKGNHGIYLLPWTVPDKFTWFAIDIINLPRKHPIWE